MAKHRPHAVHALRAVVGQIALNRRAHHARRELRAHGQFVAIQTIGETEHFFFHDVRHVANATRKQRRLLQHRRAHIAITIAFQPAAQNGFQRFPLRRLIRQNVVHAFDGAEFFYFQITHHSIMLLLKL